MANEPSTTEARPPSERRHEPEGSSSRGILVAALIFLLALALILVFVRALLHHFRHAEPSRMPGNVPAQVTSSPVAGWVDPVHDLAELRAREEEHLSTYAWVDREQGRVRIPIQRAMQRMLEEQRGAAATQPGSPQP